MLKLFGLVLILYALLCVFAYARQRSLIYYPQPGAIDTQGTTFKLPVSGADVVVSTRPHGGHKALIYFGGNAEDVGVNLPSFSQAFPDHAIYLMHYRGYGGSTGAPSEKNIQQDARALFDKVHAEHPDTVVMGRSLGSGVAVSVAAARRCRPAT